MGRHKIPIKKIDDSRNRHVTFNKRKNGLLKKAMELSLLCDCKIALVIFERRPDKPAHESLNLIQYSSGDIDDVLTDYALTDDVHQSVTNKDYHDLFISGSGDDNDDGSGEKDAAGKSEASDMKAGAAAESTTPKAANGNDGDSVASESKKPNSAGAKKRTHSATGRTNKTKKRARK